MCGILGFVGITTRNEIHEVFTSNESRGGHAWGWARFTSDNTIQLHKEPGKVKKINLPRGERISGPFIGHTRFATHGKPEENQNNHPHSSATIALVHNGVISNNKHPNQKTECDSENILKMFLNEPHATKQETIKALKKVAGELEGSFRILLINSATPQWMYVVTDELDPPYLCSDKMRIWIASEAKDLPKNNVKLRLLGKSIYTINNIGRIEQTYFKKKERKWQYQQRDWSESIWNDGNWLTKTWTPNTCYNCKAVNCNNCLTDKTACQDCNHKHMCRHCNRQQKIQNKVDITYNNWCGGIL